MSSLFILILVAVLAWKYLQRESEPGPDIIPRSPDTLKSRYRAVRIVPTTRACPAVHAVGRQRFLLGEAPRLPLERCNQIFRCRCDYKHYADRRSGDDRRQIFGSLSQAAPMGSANKRSGRDRRRGAPAEYDYMHY